MAAPPSRRSGSRFRFDPWLACAALLALIPILTIARPGMPNTADGQVHLLRALEVSRLLGAGTVYPRWAPDFYLGYGYPFFNFYAPGAHLLVSWIAWTGLGVLRSMVAVQVLALLLYPTGAYLAAKALLPEGCRQGDCFAGVQPLLRAEGPPVRNDRRLGSSRTIGAVAPAALLSAALYLYAPLRWRELFIQGNLSQLAALALVPWCAWALTRAARHASPRWAAGAGFLLALLVYVHHPSALLAFPALGIYALAVAVLAAKHLRSRHSPNQRPVVIGNDLREATSVAQGRDEIAPAPKPLLAMTLWRGIAAVIGAFCVGMLLSAPFWLPAIAEQRYVDITRIEQGMFTARMNLLPLGELLSPARLLDEAALNPPMPNALGTAQVVLALGGLATAIRWLVKGNGGETGTPDVSGQAALMGSTTNSAWSTRQTGIVLLVVAVLLLISLVAMLPVAAGAWEALPLARLIAFPWRMLGPALLWAALLGGAALFLAPVRWRTPVLVVLLVLIPLSIAPYLFPRAFAPVAEPTPADIAAYELAGGARGTASANEYLPVWVSDPDPPLELAADILAGRAPDRLDRTSLPAGAEAWTVLQAPLEYSFRLVLPEPTAVRIAHFYFPGWESWVDGRKTAVTPGEPYGLMEVAVPAGEHELRLRHGATPAARIGGLLALLGLALAGVLVWLGRRDHDRTPAPGDAEPGSGAADRDAWVAAATILALTAVLLLLVGPYTRWFRLRSSAEAPAGMETPLHARFADGIELIGYSLAQPATPQGGTAEVRLFWRAIRPQEEDVRPFLHLDSVTGDVTWANQTKLHAGDKPSSAWPAGFYVVDDYRLEIPEDTPAVVANLRAGLLDARGERVPLDGGQDTAMLGLLRVREQEPLAANSLPGSDRVYQLGPAVRLAGSSAVITGTTPILDLTLFWQAIAPVPADYTAFVHVLDADGAKIAQADGPPLGGRYPSSAWEPKQIVSDRRQIALPEGVDPAGVQVAVGLYTPADGVRAPVVDAQGTRQAEDRILLSPTRGQ